MKRISSIVGYLTTLVGCGFIAWLEFGIVSESYVAMIPGADSGYTRPIIVITSPATNVVSQPMIQIIGYYPREIETITYDITNVAGINKNQNDWQLKGYVTGQFFDKAKFDRMTQESFKNRYKPWQPGSKTEHPESALTTNFFQIYDINLAKGKNRIAIHVRDESGRQYSTKRFYTLDYSIDKTPPVIKLIWPQDKTKIGGSEFTLQAQVDDNNASIKTTIKNSAGTTYNTDAIVERSGLVWVKDLPIEPGINTVTIIATDAAGNSSTNIFSVSKSAVTVTMQPLENNQLNKSRVNVRGTVSDSNCLVKVNGIQATVHEDGTWDAKDVPVSPTGTANFEINVFEK
jgi:Glucodextranase, domain B